jgi:hypothetical protein
MRLIELLPENYLAWGVFWDARSDIARVLDRLERIELTQIEAEHLGIKLRILGEKMADLEYRSAEQAHEEMKNAGSAARNRAR